jgi:hypothetical protein
MLQACLLVGCRVPLVTDKDMASLTEEDVYRYCVLPPEALPEAFPQHNTAPTLPMLPKSGCKGLQARKYITFSCTMPLTCLLVSRPKELS